MSVKNEEETQEEEEEEAERQAINTQQQPNHINHNQSRDQ